MQSVNLLLRFLLELCALAAVAFAGSRAVPNSWAIVLAVLAPCAFAVLWGLFAAHKARFGLPRMAKALVGLLLLEASAGALGAAGRPVLAGAFALLILVNSSLLYAWHQDIATPLQHTPQRNRLHP